MKYPIISQTKEVPNEDDCWEQAKASVNGGAYHGQGWEASLLERALEPQSSRWLFFFPFFGRNQQPDSEVLKLTWKREPPRWPRQSCRRTKLDGLQPDINLLPIHR